MKWSEIVRKLKAAGYVEQRTGKGSHRLLVHPVTKDRVWITHHDHDAGQLGNSILRKAGLLT